MNETASIAGLRINELTAAIGSADISPGAGAAGAVALALACACATKGARISAKHRPADVALHEACEALEQIGSLALADATRDAQAFEAFLRRRSAGTTARLIRESDRFGRLVEEFTAVIADLEQRLDPRMRGDWVAAKALAIAAETIRASNDAEVRKGSAPAPRVGR